jgi:hypothetical protein
MRRLFLMLWTFAMLAAQPATTPAAGPLRGELGLWAQASDFQAIPGKIRAEQRPRSWDQLGSRTAEARQGSATHGYFARRNGDIWTFQVTGDVPEIRAMRWEHVLLRPDAAAGPYYVFRYRARGQRRNYQPLAVLALGGADGKGKAVTVPLLDASEVINDDRWHVVLGKMAATITAKSIEVQLSTVGSEAVVEIGACGLYAELPKMAAELRSTTDKQGKTGAFHTVDLPSLFNDNCTAALERSLGAHGKIVDGGKLPAGSSFAGAVPFRIGPAAKNIIAPPRDPKANQGTVDVLGTKLTRNNYKRVARDDRITVPAGGKASEVYFLLVSEMAPAIGRYALPSIPLQFFSADTFAVEIVYAEGEADWAFPYSLADGGHSLQRAVGAYAVPADPNRELKSLVFHNRYYGASFNLAAVTLNGGPAITLTPSRINPPPYRVARVRCPAPQPARLTADGQRLTVETGDYLCRIDCRDGFAIDRLAHKWSPGEPIALGAGSGLEVRIGERTLTGRDFRMEKLSTTGDAALISLLSKDPAVPLRLRIEVSARQAEQLGFSTVAANLGTAPLATQIRFPLLKGLAIGRLADTWMFFPQCRNVLTKEPGTYLAPNDRPFVMQFFDVFNPRLGVGLAFLTHNLNQDVIDYSVRKSAAGVEAFVQYPGEYHVIRPGGEMKLTETCLVFHAGDWHGGLAAYQQWLRTWYKPVKADGLDWWRRSFTSRSHLTKRSYSWTVPLFDFQRNRYRIDEMLKEDEAYLGLKPDVYHLGGWVDYKNEHDGDFNSGDYAPENFTGGADVLRAAVRHTQDKGVRVSLYTIPDRVSKLSQVGKTLGPQIAQLRDGGLLQDERCWYVCIGDKRWRDRYIAALKRAQKETGADAIYVDVFGYTRGYACYSKEHGHETPLNVNRACYELIRRLREELPKGVAIWSEFLLPDVNSQFTSGNITYYFLTLHDYMQPSYDLPDQAPAFTPVAQSVHRFVFPHIKQLGFPVGFDTGPRSHDLRSLFFNGEGVDDVGWLLYDSRDLVRVRNWLAIEREFADCFASSHPEPLVATEAGELYANCFPGEGRTVWTLMNARFSTYRGPVLSVEYRPGDTYYDAWNHRPLRPEIHDGRATLSVGLDPQGLGCVVRTRRGATVSTPKG